MTGINHNLRLHLPLHFWIKYIHRVETALNILSHSSSVPAGIARTGKKKAHGTPEDRKGCGDRGWGSCKGGAWGSWAFFWNVDQNRSCREWKAAEGWIWVLGIRILQGRKRLESQQDRDERNLSGGLQGALGECDWWLRLWWSRRTTGST